MTLQEYDRFTLAETQLETAIGLFVSKHDKLSAITLAGAADVILCQLIVEQGKENFTMFSLKNESSKDNKATIKSHGKILNDLVFINDLKHMDEGEDGFIDIDIDESAVAAILKALANYVTLAGRDKNFVQAFLAWVQINLDPNKYNINCDPNWEPAT